MFILTKKCLVMIDVFYQVNDCKSIFSCCKKLEILTIDDVDQNDDTYVLGVFLTQLSRLFCLSDKNNNNNSYKNNKTSSYLPNLKRIVLASNGVVVFVSIL